MDSLLVWPTSVLSLTSGSCVLIAGAVADVLGPRGMNLAGCLLMGAFILGCGLAQTGIQLVLFRAMQGIANAMTVPTSISIVSTSVADGKPRNLGFACLGLSQPLGFSVGLVLGGVFVDTLGWRSGFYIGGGLSFLLFVMAIWALPSPPPAAPTLSQKSTLQRLVQDVDWYALLRNRQHTSRQQYHLTRIQRRLGARLRFLDEQAREAKQARFDPKQHLEEFGFHKYLPHGASLRLLPNLLCGVAIELITGLIINKVPAMVAVLASAALAAIAPLLMAIINPKWPYWYDAFPAQILAPVSGDVLFTVGLIIVSASFPPQTQGLAGAVFNTVAQIGTSIGLTVLSVISTAVTKENGSEESVPAIMKGYRASFWTLFAMMILATGIGGVGLRKLGKVGEKRD
ncbi:hypothetical protein LTR78_003545 [Recurvomyces mirabilis]|uniref:Major facilitator superfamily (MFS) profile domain-containing protein n=1 Tax=Recurvomyces mirabilis TaxID=574656 RepID=A0AAE0WS14_9PEZI|nr:hypothetical protein LTR78_003545 [Recurvomyces mirabilis]